LDGPILFFGSPQISGENPLLSAQKKEEFCTKNMVGLECQKDREKNNFGTLSST